MYLEKIKNARENIKDTIIKTPLMYSPIFSKILISRKDGTRFYIFSLFPTLKVLLLI